MQLNGESVAELRQLLAEFYARLQQFAEDHPHEDQAKTLTGPAGPVIFDYQRIMGRSPKLLMALLAHESGHKVKFKVPAHHSTLDYVEDNAPALGFETGRELLDAFGLAIGNFAE